MTPEVLLIIWRLNVYYHISFCLLVASISSSWLLCMAQHISFWGFLMKISREYGGVVPKMRTTNEHIGGGLWPEMYGTSESHISPRYSDSLATRLFANSLLFEEGGAPLFTPTFLFLDGRGTFSCDDVDGILCCVICCILNDGWLLAISLAWLLVVIVSKLQQQQQTEQFFRVVETPQREIEKQQDLPGRITILISWMPLPLEF